MGIGKTFSQIIFEACATSGSCRGFGKVLWLHSLGLLLRAMKKHLLHDQIFISFLRPAAPGIPAESVPKAEGKYFGYMWV